MPVKRQGEMYDESYTDISTTSTEIDSESDEVDTGLSITDKNKRSIRRRVTQLSMCKEEPPCSTIPKRAGNTKKPKRESTPEELHMAASDYSLPAKRKKGESSLNSEFGNKPTDVVGGIVEPVSEELVGEIGHVPKSRRKKSRKESKQTPRDECVQTMLSRFVDSRKIADFEQVVDYMNFKQPLNKETMTTLSCKNRASMQSVLASIITETLKREVKTSHFLGRAMKCISISLLSIEASPAFDDESKSFRSSEFDLLIRQCILLLTIIIEQCSQPAAVSMSTSSGSESECESISGEYISIVCQLLTRLETILCTSDERLGEDIATEMQRMIFSGIVSNLPPVVSCAISSIRVFGRTNPDSVQDMLQIMLIHDDLMQCQTISRTRKFRLEVDIFVSPVSAAILHLLQTGSSSAESLENERKNVFCLCKMLERFWFQKYKVQKSSMDEVGKQLFMALVDDFLSVLYEMRWPIAELIISQLSNQLEAMLLKPEWWRHISDFSRAILVDTLSCINTTVLAKTKLAEQNFELVNTLQPELKKIDIKRALSVSLNKEDLFHRCLLRQANLCKALGKRTRCSPMFFEIASMQKGSIQEKNIAGKPLTVLRSMLLQLVMDFLLEGSISPISNSSHQNVPSLHLRLFLEQSEDISQDEVEFWHAMAQNKASVDSDMPGMDHTLILPPDVFFKEMQAASLLLAMERPLMSGISTRNARILRAACSAQHSESLGHMAVLKILRGMGAMFMEDIANQADFLKFVRGIVTTCHTSNLRHAGLILLGRYLDKAHDFDACNPNFKVLLTRMLDSTLSVRLECTKIIKKIIITTREQRIAAQLESQYLTLIRKNILVAVGESFSQKISEEEREQYVSVFSEAWFSGPEVNDKVSTDEKLDEMVAVLGKLKNFQLDVTRIFKTASSPTFQSYMIHLFGRVQGLAGTLAGMSTILGIILAFARSNPNGFEEHLPTLKSMYLTLEQRSLQGQKESTEHLWLVVDILGEVLSFVENRPAGLEESIFLSCFSGSLKFTDRKRCTNMEEIQKSIRLFCCVREEKAENLFKVILSNSMAFLRTCLVCPSEQNSAWVPRTLIIMGELVRHFKLQTEEGMKAVSQCCDDLFVMCNSEFARHRKEDISRCALQVPLKCLHQAVWIVMSILVYDRSSKCLSTFRQFQSTLKIDIKNPYDFKLLIHVLGIIVTIDPPKILSCKAVFTITLQGSSFAASKSIVLRILRNQLTSNGSCTSKIEDSSSKDKKLRLEFSSMLMHQYGSHILDASQDKAPALRYEAILLLKSTLQQGLTALYLCLPHLISQLACTGTQSAITASNLLEDLREKEASHFTAHALYDGIIKAFSFADSNVTLDAFATAFKIIAGNGSDTETRAVRQLSKRLFSRFEHPTTNDGLEGSVQCYLANVIARLTFVTLDGPLTSISCCRELITTLMENSHKSLQDICCGNLKEINKYSDGQIMLLRAECRTATLLAQMSGFLIKKYKIKPDRIKKFCSDPSVLERTQIRRENDESQSNDLFAPLHLFETEWLPTRDLKLLETDLDKCLGLVQGIVSAETTNLCAAEDSKLDKDNASVKLTKSVSRLPVRSRKMGILHAAQTTDSDPVGPKEHRSKQGTRPLDRSRLQRRVCTGRRLNDSSSDEDCDNS